MLIMIKGDKFLLNTYEYKTLDHVPNNEELEDLGSDGWELCSILNLEPDKIVYYFKRKCGELVSIREYK
jgi:hypothetical protein